MREREECIMKERKEKDNKSILSGFLWRFAERTGAQGVTFIVSILLARILAPEVYGTIALVTVFTSIMNAFVDSGFGSALIQKKDADDLDFSSVFYFNVFICCTLYVLMFFAAPLIANFYNNSTITPIIRTLSLTLIISGVKNIQHSYVAKTMQFKRFFFATLGGTIGAAIIGIYMAYRGYGVWALVAQHLLNIAVDTIILWITVKWRPKKMFSWGRLKGLFSYGWKLLASGLLDKIYGELRQLIIGKLYTTADLAFYNKGDSFPNMIIANVNSSIDSVLLPTMSAEQDNRNRVRDMTRRAIKTSTYVMMPLMMGLAVCAEPMIRILLTEKWLPCVFFLRVFCFTYAFHPIHTANLNAIKAMGRSDLFLKLEIIKKVMGLSVLAATMFISVEAMALSAIVTSILSQIINSWPNRKLLDYHYGDQLRDMLPQIGLSCLMGGIVYCVSFLGLNDLLTLLIQAPVGALIYIIGSKLFHIDSYEYVLGILKGYLGKKKKTA